MAEITWDGDAPAEVRAIVEPVLARYTHLMPPWLQRLHLAYDPNGNHCTADADSSPEYRWAKITLRSAFILETPEEREATIVHELIEVALSPVRTFTDDLIDRLLREDAPKFHGWTEEHFMRVTEGVIQDLTRGLVGREGRAA